MKIVFFLLLIPIFIQCSSKQKLNENELIISQKLENRKGIQLVLQRVFDDSRCPTTVTCVWAGEVSAQLDVFDNNELKESKTLTFNSKNKSENNAWFASYFKEKEIKDVFVLPYPEDSKGIQKEDYFIKIEF